MRFVTSCEQAHPKFTLLDAYSGEERTVIRCFQSRTIPLL
jgi:hypothetical protein